MRVNVTQRDIDLGLPGEPASCPLARAVKRLRPVAGVSVTWTHCTYWNAKHEAYKRHRALFVPAQGLRLVFKLPSIARQFVRRFDTQPEHPHRQPPQPFTFDLPGFEVPA